MSDFGFDPKYVPDGFVEEVFKLDDDELVAKYFKKVAEIEKSQRDYEKSLPEKLANRARYNRGFDEKAPKIETSQEYSTRLKLQLMTELKKDYDKQEKDKKAALEKQAADKAAAVEKREQRAEANRQKILEKYEAQKGYREKQQQLEKPTVDPERIKKFENFLEQQQDMLVEKKDEKKDEYVSAGQLQQLLDDFKAVSAQKKVDAVLSKPKDTELSQKAPAQMPTGKIAGLQEKLDAMREQSKKQTEAEAPQKQPVQNDPQTQREERMEAARQKIVDKYEEAKAAREFKEQQLENATDDTERRKLLEKFHEQQHDYLPGM